MKIIIISAVAKNNVIGKSNGEIPWHNKEEFQHFKKTTLRFPIIMGRKTFESLKQPLKGRLNIVITQKKNYNVENEIKVFNSINDALDFCKTLNTQKVFVIGGAEVYKQALNFADEMIISYMNFNADGNIFFPDFSIKDWQIISEEEREQFKIVHYKRVN
ncbi:MAG: dihydrofolate reductase [Ignavibacterium sp.]